MPGGVVLVECEGMPETPEVAVLTVHLNGEPVLVDDDSYVVLPRP